MILQWLQSFPLEVICYLIHFSVFDQRSCLFPDLIFLAVSHLEVCRSCYAEVFLFPHAYLPALLMFYLNLFFANCWCFYFLPIQPCCRHMIMMFFFICGEVIELFTLRLDLLMHDIFVDVSCL